MTLKTTKNRILIFAIIMQLLCFGFVSANPKSVKKNNEVTGKRLCSTEELPYVTDLLISPDGRKIVFYDNSLLYLYDLDLKKKFLLYSSPKGKLSHLCFSKNSRKLFIIDGKDVLSIIIDNHLLTNEKPGEFGGEILTSLKKEPVIIRLSDKGNFILIGTRAVSFAKDGMGVVTKRFIEKINIHNKELKHYKGAPFYITDLRYFESKNVIFEVTNSYCYVFNLNTGKKSKTRYFKSSYPKYPPFKKQRLPPLSNILSSNDTSKFYAQSNNSLYIFYNSDKDLSYREIRMKKRYMFHGKIKEEKSGRILITCMSESGNPLNKYYLTVYDTSSLQELLSIKLSEDYSFKESYDIAPSGKYIVYYKKGMIYKYDLPEYRTITNNKKPDVQISVNIQFP